MKNLVLIMLSTTVFSTFAQVNSIVGNIDLYDCKPVKAEKSTEVKSVCKDSKNVSVTVTKKKVVTRSKSKSSSRSNGPVYPGTLKQTGGWDG